MKKSNLSLRQMGFSMTLNFSQILVVPGSGLESQWRQNYNQVYVEMEINWSSQRKEEWAENILKSEQTDNSDFQESLATKMISDCVQDVVLNLVENCFWYW